MPAAHEEVSWQQHSLLGGKRDKQVPAQRKPGWLTMSTQVGMATQGSPRGMWNLTSSAQDMRTWLKETDRHKSRRGCQIWKVGSLGESSVSIRWRTWL